MPKVEVFEPAMCCSTGICGPSVDPVLVRFAADLQWLQEQGVPVERNNLSQQPQAFVANKLVQERLRQSFSACLPLVLVDGVVAFSGKYPTRAQLSERVGLGGGGDDLSLTVIPASGGSCCCEGDGKGGNCC